MNTQIHSILPPAIAGTEQPSKKGLAIRIGSESQKGPSHEVENPMGRDKIELSKRSLAEELSILKQREEQKEVSKARLDDLHDRLLRMESVLYQVAASVSFDADSLEKMHRRIVRELEGSKRLIGEIKLPELKPVALERLSEQIEKVNPRSREDLEELSEIMETASKAVAKMKSQAEISEDELRTSKALEIAHQNTSAALSNYNHKDIFAHADNVARTFRENSSEAIHAHRRIDHQSVINLVS